MRHEQVPVRRSGGEVFFVGAPRVVGVGRLQHGVGRQLVEGQAVVELGHGALLAVDGVPAGLGVVAPIDVLGRDGVGQRRGAVERQERLRLDVVREVRRAVGLQRVDHHRRDDDFTVADDVVDHRRDDCLVLLGVFGVQRAGYDRARHVARVVGVRRGEEDDADEHQVDADAQVRPQGRPIGVEGMRRGRGRGWGLSRHDEVPPGIWPFGLGQ